MMRIMALYPRSEGSTFDADYWLNKHMPLVGQKWPDCTWQADVAGPDQPFYAVAHIMFPDAASMGAALTSPAAGDVMGDVPNYTNVQPQIQISEIAKTS
jgi:uncharacterized protein (TIGR02118 family)